MSNYNTQLQSNNTDLQAILNAINELPEASGGEQATPEISVSSNGLITATAGTKSSTYQMAFQAAKTITPSTVSQVAVSGGYYTGGNITVAAVPTQAKTITPKATTQNVTPDSGKFLSKVTVNGDSNLVAGNIKSGVSIFGVSGNYSSPQLEPTLQDKTITTNGVYTADNNFDGLGTVTVDVQNIETEKVEYSENEDAIIDGTLSSYFNDRVETIRSIAFFNFISLTTVSFPACTSIGRSAFAECRSLTTVSFPACISIGVDAFSGCGSLTTVSFPACVSIGQRAFDNCTSLTTVSFPACISIGVDAFANCISLTTVSFPICTTINVGAFYRCSKLTTVSFSKVMNIYEGTFSNCTSLTTISFPACVSIGNRAFSGCRSLTTVSFPACTNICSGAFDYCYNLKSLYLTGSSLCKLSTSYMFKSTPIGGYSTSAGTYGSIYVPASLLTQYQTATNWVYFSSRFVAYDPIITFTIDETTYQAREGMTWGEWVESEYNKTASGYEYFHIMNYNQVTTNGGKFIESVIPTDVIIANYSYSMSTNSAFEGQ